VLLRNLFVLSVAVVLAQVDHRQLAQQASDQLSKGQLKQLYASFTEKFQAAITEEAFVATSAQLDMAIGKFQRYQGPPKEIDRGNIKVFVYRAIYERSQLDLTVVIDEAGKIAGLRLTPAADAAAAQSAPAKFQVKTGKYELPADIVMPEGEGPFPAVVLVHGSGPHDRDETIGPNKIFLQFAEGLKARGIASIRYEKRTKQYPGIDPSEITLDTETVDDALSAAALLRTQPKIDPKRIFIVGHSQGAFAAPRIAEKQLGTEPKLKGLILLAGNSRPLEVLIREQVAYLGAPSEQGEKLIESLPVNFKKQLANYDPVAVALKTETPLLILQGERDYQVTMKDFEGWQSGASKSKQKWQTKSYPALNHLFLPGEGKSQPAEYATPGRIPAQIFDDLAAWILKP
jgi:uncharacterized protein